MMTIRTAPDKTTTTSRTTADDTDAPAITASEIAGSTEVVAAGDGSFSLDNDVI